MYQQHRHNLQSRFRTDLLFSKLYFLGYEVKTNILVLNFKIGNLSFQHRDEFSIDLSLHSGTQAFDILVTFYGIAKAFKYSQYFLCTELVIYEASLTEHEKKFWQNYYDNYSLELYYSEKIPLEFLTQLTFIKIPRFFETRKAQAKSFKESVLLGVGGGKDAVYAFETLEQSHIPTALFFTYENEVDLQLREKLVQMMAHKYQRRYYSLKRVENDPEVVRAAIKQQKFNGIKPSTPAASTNAIRLALIAHCEGYHFISTCNEKSADFGNTTYLGQVVNHQYSKSLEFEKEFNTLLQAFLPSISYFSILKPLYEIRIVQGFSNLKKYFKHVNSCNRNNQFWCLNCPKCTFVFTLLAGFLNPQDTISIFGENLFHKEDLEKTFLELMGLIGVKPLECVGEKEEMWIAMARAIELGHQGRMIDLFREKVLPTIKIKDLEKKYLKLYLEPENHIIPHQILNRIKWL